MPDLSDMFKRGEEEEEEKVLPPFKYATEVPVPFDEKTIPQTWQTEPWDKNLPEKGFITDLVLATRGFETTTKFATWSALYALSALLKRDAWMKWYPKPMYPNIFMVFVAPPRVCAKSTAVDFCEDAMRTVPEKLLSLSPILSFRKEFNFHHSKATPEALNVKLQVEKKNFPDPRNPKGMIEVSKGSNLALIVSELTTFLGKQKYNVSLVDNLTKLYDSRDIDDEATVGRGETHFEDIYVTFFGATTPDSLRDSIPEEAMGGGFMSRTILISEQASTRYYPYPKAISGAASVDELANRLAWIAANAVGEYTLSREAYVAYEKWYKKFKMDLVDDPQANAKARMDTNLMKISLLIRAQRYEPGNIISLQDFLFAMFLIEDVYGGTADLLKEVSADPWKSDQIKVKRILNGSGEISERMLWAKFVRAGIPQQVILTHLQQLLTSGDVQRRINDGTTYYLWTGR